MSKHRRSEKELDAIKKLRLQGQKGEDAGKIKKKQERETKVLEERMTGGRGGLENTQMQGKWSS